MATHEVLNQAPQLPRHNVFSQDLALREALTGFAPGVALGRLEHLGDLAGSSNWQDRGMEANRDLPRLVSHDRFGNRIDEVAFNPAWHDLMSVAVEAGLHAAPWSSSDKFPHTTRAAGFLVWSQVEPGHMCPISMTYAVVPALRTDPSLLSQFGPGLSAPHYEFGLVPPQNKRGLIAGMAMTEKQGGSDVRANTTTAVAQTDGTYRITGHKWFCSAPMSDLFLVLANTDEGSTCFVVPRVLDDGSRNPFHIQRLKDKLGNRANASSEIELDQTVGFRLGEEGRGIRTIVEMVSATRLDCVLGAGALMRGATSRAAWHAAHRSAFGSVLIDKPLMKNVLADLILETEATQWLGLRLAQATDLAEEGNESERLLRRIALPSAKYWTTKRSIAVTAEALECLGGNGYAEESTMPLRYREAPVNSVWEGSGNVNALDLLRALTKEPATLDALLYEVGQVANEYPAYDAAAKDLLTSLADISDIEFRARRIAENIAKLLQASILIQNAPTAVADAFVATRIQGDSGAQFGTLPRGVDADAIIERGLIRV